MSNGDKRYEVATGGLGNGDRRRLLLAAVAVVVVAVTVLAGIRLAAGADAAGLVIAKSDGGQELADDPSPGDGKPGVVDGASGDTDALAGSEAGDASQAESAEAETLFVHIGGCVLSAGVYELPAGSRIADAVAAAQGFTDDAAPDAVNLARLLSDGERIIVPSAAEYELSQSGQANGGEEVVSAGVATEGASSEPGGKVNINAASASELEALPGIGPALAQRIVASRQSQGPFAQCEDIMRVSGIGQKKYDGLADCISVG